MIKLREKRVKMLVEIRIRRSQNTEYGIKNLNENALWSEVQLCIYFCTIAPILKVKRPIETALSMKPRFFFVESNSGTERKMLRKGNI